MTSNINLKDIEKLRKRLKELEELKDTSNKLIEIAEYVLDKECPFEFVINMKIKKEVENTTSSSPYISNSSGMDNPLDFESPQDFLENLYKLNEDINNKEEIEYKNVSLSLNNISNKAFLSILEKIIIDVKYSINNKYNKLNLNE